MTDTDHQPPADDQGCGNRISEIRTTFNVVANAGAEGRDLDQHSLQLGYVDHVGYLLDRLQAAEARASALAIERERIALILDVGADESLFEAVSDMHTEWEHYSKEMSRAGYETIPRLTDERDNEQHRADALATALAEHRKSLVKQVFVRSVDDWLQCRLCKRERRLTEQERETRIAERPFEHADTCLLSAEPDQRGRAILEAGRAMREALFALAESEAVQVCVVRDSTRSKLIDDIRHQTLALDLIRTVMNGWDRATGGPSGPGEGPG